MVFGMSETQVVACRATSKIIGDVGARDEAKTPWRVFVIIFSAVKSDM